MAILLSSFKPNELCAASINLLTALSDVLIIDDYVLKAPDVTGLCKVKQKRWWGGEETCVDPTTL